MLGDKTENEDIIMNIKKILSALGFVAAGVVGVIANDATAATVTSCQSVIVSTSDTQVCSNNNLNFTAFGVANTSITNRLFRISVAGAGVQTEGRDINRNRLRPGCMTAVNRNTSGAPVTDSSGCGAVRFHQTFVVLP